MEHTSVTLPEVKTKSVINITPSCDVWCVEADKITRNAYPFAEHEVLGLLLTRMIDEHPSKGNGPDFVGEAPGIRLTLGNNGDYIRALRDAHIMFADRLYQALQKSAYVTITKGQRTAQQ